MKIQIGIMGSAGGNLAQDTMDKVYKLGQEIARHDCALVTGGCPGLPYEATRGAKHAGGTTVGISPGLNLNEHVHKYNSPTEDIDVLIYTGIGLMGREAVAIHSCDIVIIVGGRSGTLGEFSIAYDEGKLIGILEGTGGITEIIPHIMNNIQKPTGCQIIYSPDPRELLEKLLEIYYQKYY